MNRRKFFLGLGELAIGAGALALGSGRVHAASDDGWCPFAARVYGLTVWDGYNGAYEVGTGMRLGFVDHISQGSLATMERASFWNGLDDGVGGHGLSPHFCIGRDGTVLQTVNIFDTAYHAGGLGPKVAWPWYTTVSDVTGQSDPNYWLIGIEHEGFWQDQWTPAMYAANLAVKRWCVNECVRVVGQNPLRLGYDALCGHYMFDAVNRANCPGPFWPRERLLSDLLDLIPAQVETPDVVIGVGGKSLF